MPKRELTTVSREELPDLLGNTGLLQEANRTFFNPLGLTLLLDKNLELKIHKSDDPGGATLHTIDGFGLAIFNKFRNEKHKARQERLGFVIQTKDLIRQDKLEKNKDLNLSSPESLKLNKLLRCVDDAAFEIKKQFMEKSIKHDKDGQDIDFKKLPRKIDFDMAKGKFIHVIAKLILVIYQEDIKIELDRIKGIKKEQDRVFKGEKI